MLKKVQGVAPTLAFLTLISTWFLHARLLLKVTSSYVACSTSRRTTPHKSQC